MNLALILGTVVVASLVSDVGWYSLGRRRGPRVWLLLFRIFLEPDSCLRDTENLFAQRPSRSAHSTFGCASPISPCILALDLL